MTAGALPISVAPANEASFERPAGGLRHARHGDALPVPALQAAPGRVVPLFPPTRAPSGYGGLVRNNRVPWADRDEDKADDTVWAVTCFFTRVGFRKRGVSGAVARAAVDFARARGARAVEGYPMVTTEVILEELHVGAGGVFAGAGRAEVSHPTPRWVVMRLDF